MILSRIVKQRTHRPYKVEPKPKAEDWASASSKCLFRRHCSDTWDNDLDQHEIIVNKDIVFTPVSFDNESNTCHCSNSYTPCLSWRVLFHSEDYFMLKICTYRWMPLRQRLESMVATKRDNTEMWSTYIYSSTEPSTRLLGPL